MKVLMLIFAVVFSVVACKTTNKVLITKSDLPVLIDSLYQADQSTMQIRPTEKAVEAYQKTIKTNFPKVVQIFKQYGFPGYDLVGEEISKKYFLLVQHSDFDLNFQKQVLRKMKREVENKNASAQNFAYLADRTEINSGRLQIYGTQILMSANTSIKPVVDPENLDQRRKEVGLEPINEYLEKSNKAFYMLNPQLKK